MERQRVLSAGSAEVHRLLGLVAHRPVRFGDDATSRATDYDAFGSVEELRQPQHYEDGKSVFGDVFYA